MLSTFTTEHGTLIVPTANIRSIADVERFRGPGKEITIECQVEWVVTESDLRAQYVVGTARENLERLQREELEAVEAYRRAEQRQSQGLPMLPVVRGGKVRG